jgi:hypothetical protein
MVGFIWNGSLYMNTNATADAIARDWLTAGGLNSSETITEILQNWTANELACDCEHQWEIPVMADALTEAFCRFRDARPDLLEEL